MYVVNRGYSYVDPAKKTVIPAGELIPAHLSIDETQMWKISPAPPEAQEILPGMVTKQVGQYAGPSPVVRKQPEVEPVKEHANTVVGTDEPVKYL